MVTQRWLSAHEIDLDVALSGRTKGRRADEETAEHWRPVRWKLLRAQRLT